MTVQADCSIGIKKETTFGTAVVVDRFLEFTSESLGYDRTFVQGRGLDPNTRLPRSARRALARDGGAGDMEIEVASKGLGTLWELLLGVGSSTLVSAGLYQQLFTLTRAVRNPSATIQKGVPRLGQNVVDAYTFRGAMAKSFELSVGNAGLLKLKTSWMARQVDTSIGYATPSYPAGPVDLFSFAGASLVIGGAATLPTATTLATGGTTVTRIRDFTISVDQKLDDTGYNLDDTSYRSLPPALPLAEVAGKITGEYDSTALQDALRDQAPLALVATFVSPTQIIAGQYPALQIVVPDIRIEGELPTSGGGEVITQSLDFTAYDGQVAAEPLYVVARTSDTSL